MGFFASKTLERSSVPTLLDPRFDHDSCGVGFVATLRNIPTHEILTQALTALARLAHRGAIAADGKSSDGVGIMTAIPREFLLASSGISLDAGQPLGVGVVFFPSESGPGEKALEKALAAQKLDVLAWRVVPTCEEILGEIALSSIPVIRQVLVTASDPVHFERRLYLARKQFEREAEASGYVCSFSSHSIVYKAMCAGRLLSEFYPDLADPRYVTPFAIFHQRYATNVAPSWDRA
jgi:glutamate synthase (NADPH/NADH) large chain